jgi:hypothetical protein
MLADRTREQNVDEPTQTGSGIMGTNMFCQADPLLIEIFDALQKELASALEARERLPEATSDPIERASRATVLRKIASLKIVLTELQVAIERRYSRLVH